MRTPTDRNVLLSAPAPLRLLLVSCLPRLFVACCAVCAQVCACVLLSVVVCGGLWLCGCVVVCACVRACEVGEEEGRVFKPGADDVAAFVS